MESESGNLCFEIVDDSWEVLPYTWFGVSRYGVCIENMEALPIWGNTQCLQWSPVWSICLIIRSLTCGRGAGWNFEGLWFPTTAPPLKCKRGSGCFEQKSDTCICNDGGGTRVNREIQRYVVVLWRWHQGSFVWVWLLFWIEKIREKQESDQWNTPISY